MSEYPWGIENMMLAQHDQPCDCAICDEIHFNRESRRKERKSISVLQEALAKTQVALHVSESQRTELWIERGLLSERKRNELLFAENQRMKEALQKIAHCNEPYPLSFCMNTARAALEI